MEHCSIANLPIRLNYRTFLQKTDNQTARNVIFDFDERLVHCGKVIAEPKATIEKWCRCGK
jgi:hypothetical protein